MGAIWIIQILCQWTWENRDPSQGTYKDGLSDETKNRGPL
jgi:hypothetical protein